MNRTGLIVLIIIIVVIIIAVVIYIYRRCKPCKKKKNDCSDTSSSSSTTLNENKSFNVDGLSKRSDGNYGPSGCGDVRPNFVILNPDTQGGSNYSDFVSYFGGNAGVNPNGTLNGKGVTIAIVSAYVNPNLKKDLAQSLTSEHGILFNNANAKSLQQQILSNVNIIKMKHSKAQNRSWGIEQTMEVQVIMNLVPGAKLYVVEAASDNVDDLVHAIEYAAKSTSYGGLGANVVNIGWGGGVFCKDKDGKIDAGSCLADQVFAEYPNVIFCAAAGDSGAGTQWPMVNPYVIGVGGVGIDSGSFTAWTSTGGGINVDYPGSAIQNTLYNQPIPRLTPDAAFLAEPHAGFFICVDGVFVVMGGTSLAATLMSCTIALSDAIRNTSGKPSLSQMQVQTAIYGNKFEGPGVSTNPNLFDVTTGNNTSYTATKGYDNLTGMGVPTLGFYRSLIDF